MKKILSLILIHLLFLSVCFAQSAKMYKLSSPNGKLVLDISANASLTWSLTVNQITVIKPSPVSMLLQGGEALGESVIIKSSKNSNVNNRMVAINYKKDSIEDVYNQLELNCKGDYGIIFRAYNDGVAYRFFTRRKDSLTIQAEQASFNFATDHQGYFAYVNDPHDHDKYQTSFENLYEHIALSQFVKDTVAFAPVLVELEQGIKAVITEADLEEYPGMFLHSGADHSLHGQFAPFVLSEKENPGNAAGSLVNKRANYIARTSGNRSFPWRVVVISEQDKDLLNSDMVQKLAGPSRLQDISWIKPGKASWDWWNDWNISDVNFKAGINTVTYKYYIDFASANHLEYILMDEGWSDGKDLMKIIQEINLTEIIQYATKKNVGVWLWGGSRPMAAKMDEMLAYYSGIGIKGFKIDFMDRDDQGMVEFYYELARKAAAHHLMLDFHGAYKPTGLQRTYPNVIGFEGVRGLENAKWSMADMPPYDATIPFIRMLAGPMDYTPGAMKNASKSNFRPIHSAPMSQGTRCHQLAMYVVYEAPFGMLSDNPNNYRREQLCTNFIAGVPTTFDETVALDSKVGAWASIARRKGRDWYVGSLGDWESHDITIDLSFLGPGQYEAELFSDGINADKEASDFVRDSKKFSATDILTVHLAHGGGWAAKFHKVN